MFKSWKEHYWHGVPCMKARIEEMVKKANCKDLTVLEIGCNEGFVSKALQEAGGIVTSADFNPEMIKKAKEMFDIDAVEADITKLPFEDNSFDVAVSGETLEHVPNPFQAIKELFRIAKKRVIITLPIGAYWNDEVTHKYQIDGTIIEHDEGKIEVVDKKILILCFERIRP